MSITPLRFTGVSQFSTDFQSILDRAIAIASIPISQLQNQQSDLISKKQTLGTLNSQLGALTDAVTSLGQIGANKAVSASSSNTSRVSVTLNGASAQIGYTLSNITSVARSASENTLTGYATADTTAVDTDNILQLAFNGQTYKLDLTTYGNNLNGLRDAVNALGAGVTATVLNTGSDTNPYYLSITSAATGEKTLQLRTTENSAATNILTADNQGANAVFQFNGLPIERSDNVITDVAAGLTFTILDTTAQNEKVTLKVSSSRSSLANALGTLAQTYNDIAKSLNGQFGDGAGLLSGDFLVRQMQTTIRGLTAYRGTGTIKSLADIGIELDKTGVMSFNSSAFYALSSTDFQAAFDFLGSAATGFGSLSAKLSNITDPVSGLVKTQQDAYDATDTRISKNIVDIAARIEQMQLTMSTKLQQADVLLSSLESQQNMLDANIQALDLAVYGKKS